MIALALEATKGTDAFDIVAIGVILYCVFSGTGKKKGK